MKILHTSKRMHFIEEVWRCLVPAVQYPCIRQNVCTSLRTDTVAGCDQSQRLHTSKRMHFIEESNKRLDI